MEISGRYPKELLESVEALTKFVAAGNDFAETIDRLAELAVHAIDGAEHCSVTLATGTRPDVRTVAATGEVGRDIDRLQKETHEGPCLSSIAEHETFQVPNLRQDETWPTFSRRAAEETGTNSMLSYVLRLSEMATASMNMISSKENAFTADDVDAGTIFAAQAAVAMSGAIARQDDQAAVAQLEEGMKTRQMIGQAVGILMASRGVDPDEAFEILKKASQASNVKLRVVAAQVVEKSSDL